MPKKHFIPQREQAWIDARKKHHLSHAHIRMARELGMHPAKFGKLANHQQEPWKVPLPVFIERLYFKRFGKRQPDTVRGIEQIVRAHREKKAAKRRGRQPSQSYNAGQVSRGVRFQGAAPCSIPCLERVKGILLLNAQQYAIDTLKRVAQETGLSQTGM